MKIKTQYRINLALSIFGFISIHAAAQVASAPAAAPAPAQVYLSDQLMATVLDRNTEPKLYEQGNNPWPGGSYKLEVFKDGKPLVVSGAHDIQIKIPLKIAIAGDVANTVLKFKMACTASFTTLGEVRLTPVKKANVITALNSQVTLPIPPVVANCDGVSVPVDNYLKTLLEQNKRKWELDLDAKINAWLVE